MDRFSFGTALIAFLILAGCDGIRPPTEAYTDDLNLLIKGIWALSADKTFENDRYTVTKNGSGGDYETKIVENKTGLMVDVVVSNKCYLEMRESRDQYGRVTELTRKNVNLRLLDYKRASEACVKNDEGKCIDMNIEVPGIEDGGKRSVVETGPHIIGNGDILTIFTSGHMDRFHAALDRISKVCRQ